MRKIKKILGAKELSFIICVGIFFWYAIYYSILIYNFGVIYNDSNIFFSILLISIAIISLGLSLLLLIDVLKNEIGKLAGYSLIMIFGISPSIWLFFQFKYSRPFSSTIYIIIAGTLLFSLSVFQISRKKARKMAKILLWISGINSVIKIFLYYFFQYTYSDSFYWFYKTSSNIFYLLFTIFFIVWLRSYLKTRKTRRTLDELIGDPPDSVLWDDVIGFEQWHARHSCVDELFPELLEIDDGVVRLNSKAKDLTEDEILAWIWAIRPDIENKITKKASSSLNEIIEKYNNQ